MYRNGESITKDRIQDEDWYPDYQAMLEMADAEPNAEELVVLFRLDYEDIFGKDYPDIAQLERWAGSIYGLK